MTSGTRIRKAAISAICALLLTCVSVPAASGQQNSDPSAKKTSDTTKSSSSSASSKMRTASSKKHSSRKKKSSRVRGQEKIDPERAQQIQEALIREHYLSGDASGTWNQTSEDAMRKYQADHGWQSKTVPDSRALISLGLGPSKDHLLNPESAMTTAPSTPRSESAAASSHSAVPAASPATPSSSAPVGTPASTDPSSPQRK